MQDLYNKNFVSLKKEIQHQTDSDPWTRVSIRRPGQSKGPQTGKSGCILGAQKDFGNSCPMEGYSFNLETGEKA